VIASAAVRPLSPVGVSMRPRRMLGRAPRARRAGRCTTRARSPGRSSRGSDADPGEPPRRSLARDGLRRAVWRAGG
jgi:hypothetical protein